MAKSITPVSDLLYGYLLNNWLREPDVLRDLREETSKLELSIMQISPDQGQLMAFLVKMIDARLILEIGTFTGYSALAMALATHEDARIICCDVNEEWTGLARTYWEKAGVGHKVDLRLAPALETLGDLLKEMKNKVDFAFIDADKTNYDGYFECCLELLRPGGVIAIDNIFWGGSVADECQQDEDTIAIRSLNRKLKSDERIDISVVPIGDGLTLARKL